MKKLIALLLVMTMVFSLCACGGTPAKETNTTVPEVEAEAQEAPQEEAAHLLSSPMSFKVSTTQSSNSLWVKYMTKAYEEITERTNGDLQFQLYPDGELGKNPDVVEQILAGAPMILGCGFDTMADFSDALAVASSPYVFQDMSEVFKIAETDWWDTTTEELAETANIQIFAVGTLGYRHFIGAKPVTSPDDVKKMTIRMGSDLMRNWIAVMGGSPASGAWADNYSNIQTGVFDACEATLDLLWSSSLYEVCDYLCLTGHSINPNISIMSAENWNAIPEEYQQIIAEVMEKTMSDIYDETVASENKIIEDFKAQGVEVIEDIDKSQFAPYIADLLELEGMDTSVLEGVNAALGR